LLESISGTNCRHWRLDLELIVVVGLGDDEGIDVQIHIWGKGKPIFIYNLEKKLLQVRISLINMYFFVVRENE